MSAPRKAVCLLYFKTDMPALIGTQDIAAPIEAILEQIALAFVAEAI